jgi:hypothetical protein
MKTVPPCCWTGQIPIASYSASPVTKPISPLSILPYCFMGTGLVRLSPSLYTSLVKNQGVLPYGVKIQQFEFHFRLCRKQNLCPHFLSP